MSLLNLNEAAPEGLKGLAYVNANQNAERQAQFDRDEATKAAADPKYSPASFTPETDQEYGDRMAGLLLHNYYEQMLSAMKLAPAVKDMVDKYVSADAATAAQVDAILK